MEAVFDLSSVLDYIISLFVQVFAIARTQILFRWHGFTVSLFTLCISLVVLLFFLSVFFPHVFPDDDDE